MDELILKKMRNNFGRFWNEITKEQREKWIYLSTGREDIYEEIERIMRYADEITESKFLRDYLCVIKELEEYHDYKEEWLESCKDDKDDYYNIKHNILMFWI